MSEELKKLIEISRSIKMSQPDIEKQRRSFAYGNTHFENEKITREIIDIAAEELTVKDDKKY